MGTMNSMPDVGFNQSPRRRHIDIQMHRRMLNGNGHDTISDYLCFISDLFCEDHVETNTFHLRSISALLHRVSELHQCSKEHIITFTSDPYILALYFNITLSVS